MDLKQIKKIEPKKIEKNSIKVTKNYAPNEYKIDNLNAKTAEIMKASPGLGTNNYGNQNFANNQRALINININNSNKNHKNEQTNYEKNILFKQTHNLSSSNTTSSSNCNNSYYHNQKRNYLQMIGQCDGLGNVTHLKSNDNMQFHTPLPNHVSNDSVTNKKFKYN